jgi:hypothetical protein
MRVLERGLEALCAEPDLQIPFGQNNWKNVIDQIESKVHGLGASLPSSTRKSELLAFYSRTCFHFTYFKDAWRNHVMHARKDLDLKESTEVIEHVKRFMAELSTRLQGL